MAVVDAPLDAGADIEVRGAVFTDGTPMSDAVVFGEWRAARRLLERGATTTVGSRLLRGLTSPGDGRPHERLLARVPGRPATAGRTSARTLPVDNDIVRSP